MSTTMNLTIESQGVSDVGAAAAAIGRAGAGDLSIAAGVQLRGRRTP